MCFSPFIISQTMAMTYAGASNNTKLQMKQALEFDINNLHEQFSQINNTIQDQKNIVLTINNKLWPQQGHQFQQNFLELIKKNYNSDIQQLDFINSPEDSRQKINNYVQKATNQKINNLLPQNSINNLTRMVITSCIYFKGLWKIQFQKKNTQKMDFYLENNETVQADFMKVKENFNYYTDSQLSLLELPYQGDKFCMGVVLPQKDIKIQQIEEYLKVPKNLQQIQNNTENKKIDVYLPKFKFEYTLSLKEYLQKLGMKDAFSKKSDFSEMSKSQELVISDIIHKACIEVNEEGTEAAASTAVLLQIRCIQNEIFLANKPFIFYIKNIPSNTLLFYGKLNNPLN